jgi:hypothetical protein
VIAAAPKSPLPLKVGHITRLPTAATILSATPRPKPADLVQDVLAKLRATRDADIKVELLCLGIDVLKRRQAELEKGPR